MEVAHLLILLCFTSQSLSSNEARHSSHLSCKQSGGRTPSQPVVPSLCLPLPSSHPFIFFSSLPLSLLFSYNAARMLPPVPHKHGTGTPPCFFSNQTCNRCSFSSDVHTVASLLHFRSPTLPTLKSGDEFLSRLFLFCSLMCHRRRPSSPSYLSTLCAFWPFIFLFHKKNQLSPFLTSCILYCIYVYLYALAVLRREQCSLFLLWVMSV